MTTKLQSYSTTPASNNSSPPNGWPEGQAPSSVNNCAREMMARMREWYQDAEWIGLGHTINSASGSDIVLSGDVSAYYPIGRAVRADSVVGRVTNTVFATNTTVTVSVITFAGAPTTWEVGLVSSDDSLPLPTLAITDLDEGTLEEGGLVSATATALLPLSAAEVHWMFGG
ncbi:hypothetical protein [Sphingomonas sp.]|jgi:hypothetical protein|uniref:hypothetical protein n=1 Tax=Sphingomonas sp. TaxID=28214 RepID=UPI00356573BD